MKTSSQKTFIKIYRHPVSANIRWCDIEALLIDLGAKIEEGAGSRIAVVLFGQVMVFHRPHPKPTTDKAAVVSVRKWLQEHKVTP